MYPLNVPVIQADCYFQKDNPSTILSSGTTKETFATFEELEAKTGYSVKVFIVTSGGWNEEKYLLIDAVTKAAGKHSTFSSQQMLQNMTHFNVKIQVVYRLLEGTQNVSKIFCSFINLTISAFK